MASHIESPEIAESEFSLANMRIVPQIQDNDDMVSLQITQSEPAKESDNDGTPSDSSLAPKGKPVVPRSRAKKARKIAHQTLDSKPFLRPAKDILSRIRHDPALDEADFIVGYHDRHAPELMEMDVASWKGGGDFTDEEWIPQHRVVYFRRKRDEAGKRVWDREKRLDRLFGSGIVANENEEQMEQSEQEGQGNELEEKRVPDPKSSVTSNDQGRIESLTQKPDSKDLPPSGAQS
ncbi:hypothetical protein N7G274_004059 [Stereocaulon virgatum]|uniref:MJ1316 RNA cyclic group end recognition domain-containing protein n=1 Tax=Stereocaulon virgatum TaxID=373712 RepID=A0ABR4AC04_9LECA